MGIQFKIDELRATADFLVRHRTILEQMQDDGRVSYVSVYPGSVDVQLAEHDGERETMSELKRALRPGRWEKEVFNRSFDLTSGATADEPVYLRISGHRDAVCTARVVGKERKEIAEVPYQPARVEMVDKIEWDCGNLLEETVEVAS
jgi:hypothetical protein